MAQADENRLTPELEQLGERLRAERPQAGSLQLDRIKTAAMARASKVDPPRTKGTSMKSRVASVVVVAGLLLGGTAGVVVAGGGIHGGGGSSGSASHSQYCPPYGHHGGHEHGGGHCGDHGHGKGHDHGHGHGKGHGHGNHEH